MKFIEPHLPIEAGKHNMHTDSEELSDSVSFDNGRPVECNCLCVFSLFEEYFCSFVCVCVVCTGRMCLCEGGSSISRLNGLSRDYVQYVFTVCFKESCAGVCRWLNVTLYNSSAGAQLLCFKSGSCLGSRAHDSMFVLFLKTPRSLDP